MMIKKAVAYARKDLSREQNLVFIHQGVNGDNFAFNATTGQITGIFDFSDAGIGPYSWGVCRAFRD
jgi:Ser/Thr protein kinase RdoA (MazF antagonist)